MAAVTWRRTPGPELQDAPIAIAEESAVERAARGDHAAFERLLAVRIDGLFRTACAILGNEADARDAVQDACVSAWLELQRLRDIERFDAWLSRVLVNVCRMRLRHLGRVREIPMQPEHDRPGDPCADPALHEDTEAVSRAFGRLKADDRAILVLHHLEHRSVREIAAAVGIPVGTLKWRLHAARSALGHEYAYVRRTDAGTPVTVIVDVDTGGSRELPGVVPAGERSWSPDGRWLMSAPEDGSLVIIDTATGFSKAIVLPASDEPPDILDVAWSPDSSSVAFVAEMPGMCDAASVPTPAAGATSAPFACSAGHTHVLVASLEGAPQIGMAHLITGDISDAPSDYKVGPGLVVTWSPDGKWIAYRARSGLSIVRPDGSHDHDLVTSPVGWFAWATDSTGLDFRRSEVLRRRRGRSFVDRAHRRQAAITRHRRDRPGRPHRGAGIHHRDAPDGPRDRPCDRGNGDRVAAAGTRGRSERCLARPYVLGKPR